MDEITKEAQRRKAAVFLNLLLVEQRQILRLKQLTLDVMEGKVQAEEAMLRLLTMQREQLKSRNVATGKLFNFLYMWSGAPALDQPFTRWRNKMDIQSRREKIQSKEPEDGV
jgi:hypothetical protein